MHFTYQERLQLVALTCQVAHGKFDPSTAPPLGVLDVIGKDRRQDFSGSLGSTVTTSKLEVTMYGLCS